MKGRVEVRVVAEALRCVRIRWSQEIPQRSRHMRCNDLHESIILRPFDRKKNVNHNAIVYDP